MRKISENTIMRLVLFLLIIQPFLELKILYEESIMNFFIFSPATIIRYIGIAIIGIFYLIVNKKEKIPRWIIIYGVSVFIYIVLHHINALYFKSLEPNGYGYSLISELLYISRLILPIIIMYVAYNLKFNLCYLETLIKSLIVVISFSIVITNFFEISLLSYTNQINEINFFEWFLPAFQNYNHESTATKGYFLSANCIATLCILITPVWFYFFLIHFNKMNILITFMHLLAMLILGTRVSTYGIIIITIITIILYFFFVFIKCELEYDKNIIYTFACFVTIIIIIIPYSPLLRRSIVVDYSNQLSDTVDSEGVSGISDNEDVSGTLDNEDVSGTLDNEEEIEIKYENYEIDYSLNLTNEELKGILFEAEEILNDLAIDEQTDFLKNFLLKHYYYYGINYRFMFISYKYNYDPHFWFDFFHEDYQNRVDNRFVINKILLRVKEFNNNVADDYLGITYTRMSNIFNLERDFLSHYYTLGILGLILLVPYWMIIFVGLYILYKFKKNFTYFNCMLCFGICFSLFSAYYAGNSLDNLSYSLLLGFIIGCLLNNVFHKTNN